ncbi:DNA polymerase III subunit delta' [Acidobacteriota bacterium]
MAYNDIIGHDRVKGILSSETASGKASGTYLFWGPDGVGKKDMAYEFGRALLCKAASGDACDQCRSCIDVSKGAHPDFMLLKPEGSFIKIEHLRELSRELTFRPFSGAKRVAIIENADKMRPEAANAMLKTLEEPPEDTVIILVTSHSEALLPTVRSRCKKIPFGRLSRREVEHLLIDRHSMDPDEAALLSRISEGSLHNALNLDIRSYLEDREALADYLGAGSENEMLARGMKLVRNLRNKPSDRLESFLDVFSGLVRDVAVLIVGGHHKLYANGDFIDGLSAISRGWDLGGCRRVIFEIQVARKELMRFANKHLLLLSLFIRTARKGGRSLT